MCEEGDVEKRSIASRLSEENIRRGFKHNSTKGVVLE